MKKDTFLSLTNNYKFTRMHYKYAVGVYIKSPISPFKYTSL